MISKASKKMDIFLLIATVAHCSSVMAMDNPVDVGSRPATSFDFYRKCENAKNGVTTSYPYNGALSEFQTQLAAGGLTALLSVGSLFLAQNSSCADDRKIVTALVAMPSVLGGAAYTLLKRYTPQAIYNRCERDLKELENDSLLKACSTRKNDEAIIKAINETVSNPDDYVLYIASQKIYKLEKRAQELEPRLKQLQALSNPSSSVITDNISHESITTLVNRHNALERHMEQIKGALRGQNLRSPEAKATSIEEKKFMASQSWKATAFSLLPGLTSFFTMFSSYFLMSAVLMAASNK